MKVAGIILAAGSSSRYKTSSPKQFREFDGKPIIDYTIETMKKCNVDYIILVVTQGWERYAYEKFAVDDVVTGGRTRQHSTYNALDVCPDDTKIVVIHDAARPLIKPFVMLECINAVKDGADGAEPVIDSPDTITKVFGKTITDIPSRKTLKIAHTPQVFDYQKILSAYEQHLCHLDDFTDDMGVAVYSGLKCVTVRGTIDGHKLTYPYDYEFLSNLKIYAEADSFPVNVTNKEVLLLGGSGGIGKEVKRILEDNGASVYAPSSKQVDLSDDSLDLSWFDTYDIIINCAGVMYKNDLDDPEDFDKMTNIHFRSCVNIVRNAQKLMPRGGNIVFIGSSAATSPRAMIALYSAMKAAIVNFTRSAAELLKPHGIRVNCVSPARVKTRMMKVIGLYESECLDPADVAMYIVGYACSPFTGQTINIRKGMQYG